MKWLFYFLVVGAVIFFAVQYFVGGSGVSVKELALSYPPENQSDEQKKAAREQLRMLRAARDLLLEGEESTSTNNDGGVEFTVTMTNSLAKYIFGIYVKNPFYVEIVQTYDAGTEAFNLADTYCHSLTRAGGQRIQLPAGRIYIAVVPENRKGVLAEKIC